MATYNGLSRKILVIDLALFTGAVLFNVVNADNFHAFKGARLLYSFGKHVTRSAIDCCRSCDKDEQCVLANYNRVTRECTFANDAQVTLSTATTDNDWTVYTKALNNAVTSSGQGNMVFYAKSGIGASVYEAFVQANNVDSSALCNPSNIEACTLHFRNSSLDNWAILNIRKVRYSLFENGTEVAYVVFNGTSSTSTNWFSPTRVLESSWSSLLTTTFSSPPNNFAIQSWATQLPFMMCTEYGSCASDSFYSVIVDGPRMCAYGSQSSYPQILYSKVDGHIQPESGNSAGLGKAQAHASFVFTVTGVHTTLGDSASRPKTAILDDMGKADALAIYIEM